MAFELEKTFWVFVAEYYNVKLSKVQLDAYSDDVKGFSGKDLKLAFELYRKDPENQYMPRPNQILKYVNNTISTISTANEVVSRINYAISRIGYPYRDEAREYIGEIGWYIVVREGGWEEVCRNSDIKAQRHRNAQWRDLAVAVIERSQVGKIEEPPRLPEPRKTLSLQELMPQLIK